MSKELEAFYKITSEIKFKDIQLIQSELDFIKQSLTPPTEEEVCKALSEYYGYKILFNGKCFYSINNQISHITLQNEIETIDICTPPHLIEMIGKFYKELSNNE